MNPALAQLQPYPFERLAQVKQSVTPPNSQRPIDLSIGEPKHPAPAFIGRTLTDHLGQLGNYPSTHGIPRLRTAIAAWLARRFNLPDGTLTPEGHVLPVNGTREALFAFVQCCVDSTSPASPVVVMPNPFYQIYEGAALLAGAQPWYVGCRNLADFRPDFRTVPPEIWQRCQVCYICTPGNPGGATFTLEDFAQILELADKHDFIVGSDECYCELYADEDNPPLGLLQAAMRLGRHDFNRCIVFHSLSKRSNVPGLRSGAVAGDPEIIRQFLRYRTYHGCAMPLPTQEASIVAWEDEKHVVENRRLYARKFRAVIELLKPVLPVIMPAGGFYLWPEVPDDDVEFVRGLYAANNVLLLPGSYLSRTSSNGENPGSNRVRIALVPSYDDCIEGAQRIVDFLKTSL
jgi:N-succinyldiaminopimelate aminotransferase